MYYRKTSKDGVILINYFHFKTTIKRTIDYLSGAVLKNIYFENILPIVINASVAEFIYSKMPCFRQILMNLKIDAFEL